MKRVRGLLLVFVVLIVGTLAACATSTASPPASDSGGDQTGATQELAAWSMDSDCTECHETEATSDANSECMTLMHASEQCTTCHTDEKGKLTKAHEDYDSGEVAVKLKKTKVSRDVCLSCHDLDEIIAATADSTVCTDYYGEVANPHDVPVNDDHTRDLECGACHKMHQETPVTEVAPGVCEECHHYNVYTCHPCHDPVTGAGING